MTKLEAEDVLKTFAGDGQRSHEMANAFVGVCVHFKTDNLNAGDALAALLSTAHVLARRIGLGTEVLGLLLEAVATLDPRGEPARAEA